MSDDTKIEVLEKRIKELEEKLNFKEKEVDSLKSVFLANISHEIRTPMNAIVGFSSLLKDSEFTAEEKDEFVDEVIKSSSNLTDLIEDVIEVANLQFSKKLQALKDLIVPSMILQDVIEEFQLRKESLYKSQIDLKKRSALDNHAKKFISNPRILRKIMKNLIDNAFKYTKTGSIELDFEYKNNYIEFLVKDTGVGISKERLSLIHENFHKLWQRDGDVLYNGIGIGLSTAKNFIDILGGIIQVQSEEGIGTAFYISIPLQSEFGPLSIDQIDKKDPYHLPS